ncbi:glycerol acyltransferase [Bacteroidia bacterium]|nr:glycerol acyltransferase [Bacteroidia bacterium]
MNVKFDGIRPYEGKEVVLAVNRLRQEKDFLSMMSALRKTTEATILATLDTVHSRDDFQKNFIQEVIDATLKYYSDGLFVEGLEYLQPDKTYVFITNHRDIVLDSAILNYILLSHNLKYSQAAIGSNLLVNQWVTDTVKLMSCFIIERNLLVKEMLVSSILRSEYVRELLSEGTHSVWIAQKEGRTKNGDDKTQPSLLKMLNMSGGKSFADNFKSLRVVPVAISYEWESCDALKTKELYTKQVGEYVRTPGADMESMTTGWFGAKGRISFVIGKPIDEEMDAIDKLSSKGEKAEALAKLIDAHIHRNFKLWPNNYIAYDLLHSATTFADKYTQEEKETFTKAMHYKVDKITGSKSVLNNIFLEIYANPVRNYLKISK